MEQESFNLALHSTNHNVSATDLPYCATVCTLFCTACPRSHPHKFLCASVKTVTSLSTQFGWCAPGSFHCQAPASMSLIRQHWQQSTYCPLLFIRISPYHQCRIHQGRSSFCSFRHCYTQWQVWRQLLHPQDVGVLHRLSDAALFLHSFAGVFHPRLWQAPIPILLVCSLVQLPGRYIHSLLLQVSLHGKWFGRSFYIIIPIKPTKVYGWCIVVEVQK